MQRWRAEKQQPLVIAGINTDGINIFVDMDFSGCCLIDWELHCNTSFELGALLRAEVQFTEEFRRYKTAKWEESQENFLLENSVAKCIEKCKAREPLSEGDFDTLIPWIQGKLSPLPGPACSLLKGIKWCDYEQWRRLFKNNPDIVNGTLSNLDGFKFTAVDLSQDRELVSNVSFKGASFINSPNVNIQNFANCDFTGADLSQTGLWWMEHSGVSSLVKQHQQWVDDVCPESRVEDL